MTGPARLRKPPFAARRVIESCFELSWTQKAVWLRIDALNLSERGCYASAERLAEDTGMGARNIDNIRSDLRELGLLVSDLRKGRGGSAWFAWLPPSAIPASSRPTQEEMRACVSSLDRWILENRAASGLGSRKATFLRGKTRPENPHPGAVHSADGVEQEVPHPGAPIESEERRKDVPDTAHPCAGQTPEMAHPGAAEVIQPLPSSLLAETLSAPPSEVPPSARAVPAWQRAFREGGAVIDGVRRGGRGSAVERVDRILAGGIE